MLIEDLAKVNRSGLRPFVKMVKTQWLMHQGIMSPLKMASNINSKAVNVPLPVRRPNKINDQIDTFAISSVFNYMGEILRLIVGDMGGSIWDREEPLQLFFGGCRRCDRFAKYCGSICT